MWYFYFYVATCVATAEVITLFKEKSITCVVTEDTVTSPVYVKPPMKSGFNEHVKEIDEWLIDDWQILNSVDSYQNIVTDKRWEDFKMADQSIGQALKNHSQSLPFSICLSESAVFNVVSSGFVNEKLVQFPPNPRRSNTCTWFHYIATKNGSTIQFTSDDEDIVATYEFSFDPHWIYFGDSSSNNTFWKLHSYDFRASETPTQDVNSVVSVTFSENLCLSMYVSVDKDSFLDVILESNNKTTTIIGFNKPNSLKTWQKVEIEAEYPGQQNVSFFRGRIQPGENGYWAIDKITFCDKDTEIYEVLLDKDAPEIPSGPYLCDVLNKSHKLSEQNILSCDKPGFLGEDCSISCSAVLGPSYPFCQNYTICQKNSCFCSWGYQGPRCDKTCNKGTWGLFCKNKCKAQCSRQCHPSTGECLVAKNNTKPLIGTKMNSDYYREYLPKNITITSNQIHLFLPEIDRNMTYSIVYLCANKWCRDNIIKEETVIADPQKAIIFSNLQSALPVTSYKVIVKAQVLNETLEKTYEVLRQENQLNITDFSVYCSNSSTLWIRFLNPNLLDMDSAAYKIWYYEQNSRLVAKNVVTTSSCMLWQGFVCGEIENLRNGTNYTIIVEAMETQYHEWGLSTSFAGFTSEKAPQKPDHLKMLWSSNYETVLSWGYPSITNGPLRKFMVGVETDEDITKHSINISKPQRTYDYKLSLNCSSSYKISVSALNTFESEKSTISITFLPINPKFSAGTSFMMEVCSTRCYWMVPKPEFLKSTGLRKFTIVVVPAVQTIDDIIKYLKTKGRRDDNGKGWIFLKDTNVSDDYCSVDIGTKLEKVDFKKKYSLYYVVEDITDNNYSVYLIRLPEEEIKISKPQLPVLKLATTPLAIIPIAVLLSLILLLLLLRLHRMRATKNNLDQDVSLLEYSQLSSNDPHDGVTKIGTRCLEHYLKTILQTGKELVVQFRSVPVATRPMVHAFQNINKNKNKNSENVPYDYNRVVLAKMEGMGTDDYINASYISGLDRPKAYIATQGPKFSTIKDFWRMIWQEQVETIVMATNFTESKKRKCAEYFPIKSNACFECGDMLIQLIDQEDYEHYIARFLEVSYRRSIRKIQHFQLTWNPDSLSPFYSNCIVPLIKRIGIIREKSNKPIVVHCSYGVNRTGTLILCDLAMHMGQTKNSVDFYNLLKNLRDQRPNMICSEKQYILAHIVVLECLMEYEDIFKKSINDNLNLSVLKHQLDYLKRLSWHDDVVHSWSPRSGLYNYLCCPVDGYMRKGKFLTTQQPSKNSLNTFWTMIVQEKVHIIALLNKEKDQLWPYYHQSNSTFLSVKEIHSVRTIYCSVTKLLLMVVQMPTNAAILEQTIYVFQAHNYDRCLNLNNIDEFLNILDDINKNQYPVKPTLVVCYDGTTKCGVFVALDYVTQKWKKEFEIDICNAIRTIRRRGIPFIKTTIEMEFLYKAVVEYLQKFDGYTTVV